MTLALLPARAGPTGTTALSYSDEVVYRVAELREQGVPWAEIAAMPGMPASSTMREWPEREEFRHVFARASRDAATAYIHRATRELMACNPDAPPVQTSSARVSLANYRAAHFRHLAGCLDREKWGERPAVAVQVNVAGVAFTKLGVSAQGDDE